MRDTASPVREALVFVALTLGLTWALWIPLAAGGIVVGNFAGKTANASWALVPYLLGGFVPSLMALLLTGIRQGKPGLRSVGRSLTRFRIGWRWYLAAAGLVALPAALQIAIVRLLGHSFDLGLFARQLPTFVPLIVIGPLSEEIGWRGYLQDRLQARLSPLLSGLVVGVAWACWHLPLFFMRGTSQHEWGLPFLGFLLGVTAMSLLFTWLHNNTGGAIWTAVFFHWLYTCIGQVVATGATRSAQYNWLEYTPYVAAALFVLAATGLRSGRFGKAASAG